MNSMVNRMASSDFSLEPNFSAFCGLDQIRRTKDFNEIAALSMDENLHKKSLKTIFFVYNFFQMYFK